MPSIIIKHRHKSDTLLSLHLETIRSLFLLLFCNSGYPSSRLFQSSYVMLHSVTISLIWSFTWYRVCSEPVHWI